MPEGKQNLTALAIGAHPDDIEFGMVGTLLLLGEAGYGLHYMTLANGCYGSTTMSKEETARVRTQEAQEAARLAGATYHPPIADDLRLFYTEELIMKLGAVVRKVNPRVLLVHSPQDYMEDHINACRLAVTAAFCRNIPNYPVDPPVEAVDSQMAIYHATPIDMTDQLGNPVRPQLFVNIGSVMDRARETLASHRSQKEWLDATQGMESYLVSMEQMARRVGRLSGRFDWAEGWRQHSARGFGPEDFDPLSEALGELVAGAPEG